jgi:hypothetical protein
MMETKRISPTECAAGVRHHRQMEGVCRVLGGRGTMRRMPNLEMSHECRTGETGFTGSCEGLAPIEPEGLGEEIRGEATIGARYHISL